LVAHTEIVPQARNLAQEYIFTRYLTITHHLG
jgi:hypothetical protein